MNSFARLQNKHLRELFQELPAIALYGAKAVGKTFLAEELVKSSIKLDSEVALELAKSGIESIRSLGTPLLIDEWQRYPQVWDYIRRLVDEKNTPAQYLLTGSSLPKDAPVHSGAGRIVRIRMRPLSLQERNLDEPTVSLADLLSGNFDCASGHTKISLTDYLHEIVASGFPAINGLSQRAIRMQLNGYISNITNIEFAEQGVQVRKPQLLLAWLKAYAAATASTASYQTILKAATPGEAPVPSKTTTSIYRDTIDNLWLTDRVGAWLPTNNNFAALAITQKHYLADPALSARLLNLTEEKLLRGAGNDVLGPQGGTIAGRLFEALVALSLQVYATVNEQELMHFRTGKGDHEVDFILERDNTLVAIEVKMTEAITDYDVRHLMWLEGHAPTYKTVKIVIYTGSYAYTRRDGVHVIPAVLLGA